MKHQQPFFSRFLNSSDVPRKCQSCGCLHNLKVRGNDPFPKMGKQLSKNGKATRGATGKVKSPAGMSFRPQKKPFHDLNFPDFGNHLSRFRKAKMAVSKASENEPFFVSHRTTLQCQAVFSTHQSSRWG